MCLLVVNVSCLLPCKLTMQLVWAHALKGTALFLRSQAMTVDAININTQFMYLPLRHSCHYRTYGIKTKCVCNKVKFPK